MGVRGARSPPFLDSMAPMVLFLVVSQALAGDPTPAGSDAPGEPAEAEGAPAPREAPPPAPPPPPELPLFDVVVVKKGDPSPVVAPASAAPTVPAPALPAPAASPAPFDVTVVAPGARLGGEITPPPLPAGTPPPPAPPKEAPPGVAPGVSPTGAPPPISALPGFSPPPPAVSPPPSVAPAAPPVLVVEIAPPPAAPLLPPGVGLRLTKGDSWRVKDAADLRYTTVQFARLVGDRETLRALDNAREFGKIGSTALAISGGGLLVASLVVVTSNIGQPSMTDYSVDPTLYEEEADYDAAEEFAKGQYDKSIAEWQSQRLGSTLFLVGTGAVVLAGAPFIGRDNEKREQRPELVYSRERAQQWVDAYNAAHPPAPPAGAPAPVPAVAPEGGALPPGAVAPDEAGAPPTSRPPPAKGGALDFDDEPDEPLRLELRPLVGVGFVGLSGRF